MRTHPLLPPWAAGLIGLAAFLAAIEAGVALGLINGFVVPPPSALPDAFVYLWQEGDIAWPLFLTFAQGAAATALAALVGVPAGWLLWRRPVLGAAYDPWLGALFAAPLILLYPLFLVMFGRTYVTTIVVGFLAAVIPVILKTREGLAGIPPVLLNVGRSFGVSPRALMLKIIVPAAAPAAFTGLRLALIFALVNIIGLEYLIDFGGLGRVVSDMYFRFQFPATYAAVVLVLLVSFAMQFALKRLETWIRPK
jgi:ABC-type nitrate/sulfonate/bicarbonate transport system permease component